MKQYVTTDGWGNDVNGLMSLPCGSIAYFDHGSGYSYRCSVCMATVGSIGQPKKCKDKQEQYHSWAALGGKDWDYFPND